MKNLAPGEARTPDLRISLSVLTYKYDALTDCATGAEIFDTPNATYARAKKTKVLSETPDT